MEGSEKNPVDVNFVVRSIEEVNPNRNVNIKNLLVRYFPETQSKIMSTIDETIIRAVTELGIPFPTLDLMSPEQEQESPNTEAVMSKDNLGDYYIKYSRGYLDTIAEVMDGDNIVPDLAEYARQKLISNTGHEAYHVREAIKFPERFDRTSFTYNCRIELAKEPHSSELDWGEFAADLYAIRCLNAQSIPIEDLEEAARIRVSKNVRVGVLRERIAERHRRKLEREQK